MPIADTELDYLISDLLAYDVPEPAILEQAAEECAELGQALLKLARILRNENPTPVTELNAIQNIIEELSDVALCMRILRFAPNVSQEEYKCKRWIDRVDSVRKRKEIDE